LLKIINILPLGLKKTAEGILNVLKIFM